MFPVDADGKTENDPKRFPRFEIEGVGAEGTDKAKLKIRNKQKLNKNEIIQGIQLSTPMM
jgi:hypothetical protein